MQLDQPLGGAVEAAAGKDVGERRVRRLRARLGVLRHVAQAAAAQHQPGDRVVLSRQHLEQARLAGAVASDQSDLVARPDREVGAGQDPACGDIDGEVPNLKHRAMLRRGQFVVS